MNNQRLPSLIRELYARTSLAGEGTPRVLPLPPSSVVGVATGESSEDFLGEDLLRSLLRFFSFLSFSFSFSRPSFSFSGTGGCNDSQSVSQSVLDGLRLEGGCATQSVRRHTRSTPHAPAGCRGP